MSRAGVFLHRVVRAVRSFLRVFRAAGLGQHRTGDHHLSARSQPTNPWPRCVACHRRVADLCPSCGVCPSCCDPASHERGEAGR